MRMNKTSAPKNRWPAFVIIIFFLYGCDGCDEFCTQSNFINPVFVGFAPSDIDTLYYKQYKEDGDFDSLINSVMVIDPATNGGIGCCYTKFHDTTIVYPDYGVPGCLIYAGYDWKIFIPAINRTISITNIVSDPAMGERGCTSPITSFVQDGQLIINPYHSSNMDSFYTSGYRAYIYP